MSSFQIIRSNSVTPLSNVNGSLVNTDGSNYSGSAFTSIASDGKSNPNVMPEPQNNIQAAASYIPCSKGGKKINRKKINKISRKYKMKGSKKKRHSKKMKSILRSKTKRRSTKRSQRRSYMKGGIAHMPHYPEGYAQFDNNKPMNSNFSTGGPLPNSLSALANPPPITKLGGPVDNLNHYAKNIYGHNVGSGFPSRGWW